MELEQSAYRHEFKYLISSSQAELLKQKICGLMALDPNVSGAGKYSIRSVYFDDYSNRCFYENENGVDPREKYRIRIYNHSAAHIRLERKEKTRGKTRKISCTLTEEQARVLLAGKYPSDYSRQPELLKVLSREIMERGMRPVVIVDYDRVPYIYRLGNVRVTLDHNLSSSNQLQSFFDPMLVKRPVMPAGMQLLEVKFDEYLPDHIYRALQIENLQHTAFSKYYLCRKYSLSLGGKL